MKYDRIKEIINRWDPIDLLSHAPDDEYDFEIQAIPNSVLLGMSEVELGKIVYNIFVYSFGEDTFQKNISECNRIAKEILSN